MEAATGPPATWSRRPPMSNAKAARMSSSARCLPHRRLYRAAPASWRSTMCPLRLTPAARDLYPGGRERQRQDHAGEPAPPRPGPDARQGAVRGARRRHDRETRRAQGVHEEGPAGIPEPFRDLQPTAPRRGVPVRHAVNFGMAPDRAAAAPVVESALHRWDSRSMR